MYIDTATDDELTHKFIYGLKDNIRVQVLVADPSSLSEAMTVALTIEDRR